MKMSREVPSQLLRDERRGKFYVIVSGLPVGQSFVISVEGIGVTRAVRKYYNGLSAEQSLTRSDGSKIVFASTEVDNLPFGSYLVAVAEQIVLAGNPPRALYASPRGGVRQITVTSEPKTCEFTYGKQPV